MYCVHCKKDHAGYRCPYCGNFELTDTELYNRHSKSVYAKSQKKSDRGNLLHAIFLICFLVIFLTILVIGIKMKNSL